MTIAQELEGRLAELSDPKVKWVQGTPQKQNEQCLLQGRREPGDWVSPHLLSLEARYWLARFLDDYWTPRFPRYYPFHIFEFNDEDGQTRQNVLWMLEEAVEQARWEGV